MISPDIAFTDWHLSWLLHPCDSITLLCWWRLSSSPVTLKPPSSKHENIIISALSDLINTRYEETDQQPRYENRTTKNTVEGKRLEDKDDQCREVHWRRNAFIENLLHSDCDSYGHFLCVMSLILTWLIILWPIFMDLAEGLRKLLLLSL